MQQLSRELALRIALASRVLPGVDVKKLLGVLHEKVGSPLDDEKLKSITVTNLKTGIGSWMVRKMVKILASAWKILNWRYAICGEKKKAMTACRKFNLTKMETCLNQSG